jgi:hypothetical protein
MEAIERTAQIAQDKLDTENASNIAIKTVLSIVHDFLTDKKVMAYGGTAINNLLPKEDQFYDPKKDIPDYDFFSMTPQIHAMELADRIARAGYKLVEVKPGMHLGTFKVFADFTGVADITLLEKSLFERLWVESVVKDGIHYVHPNFLRMSVYLELSRPRGDVSRWTKVYSRINLLNKHYPIVCPSKDEKVSEILLTPDIRDEIEHAMVSKKMVLLGFNASMIQKKGAGQWKLPLDLMVEPNKRDEASDIFESILSRHGGVRSVKGGPFGELLPHFTDIVNSQQNVLVRIYETNACHSYHTMSSGLRVASIPTLLQFFLVSLYTDEKMREGISEQRYVCAAQHLLDMANDDAPRRYKLLTPMDCVGKQDSIVDIRVRRANIYEKLSTNKSSPEFLENFFTYDPTKTTPEKKKEIKKKLMSLKEDHSD